MRVFFRPQKGRQTLLLLDGNALVHLKRINKCVCALTIYALVHILCPSRSTKPAGNTAL
ncbi:protein of unknown function [Pseudomonas mediterranea]